MSALGDDYESIVLVKPEVFVYEIPPRTSNRSYRAADWKLETPSWTGRLRLTSKADKLSLKLEDRDSGVLFAQCPIEAYPGAAIEAVSDSSRYFVIRIVSDRGAKAFIGLGFTDRGDSFDLNVSLQDYFKKLRSEEEPSFGDSGENAAGPKLDLSFKEGETIKINIGGKIAGNRAKRAPATGGIGLLPPPPSNKTRPQPPVAIVPPQAHSASAQDDSWGDFFGQSASSGDKAQPTATTTASQSDPTAPLVQF